MFIIPRPYDTWYVVAIVLGNSMLFLITNIQLSPVVLVVQISIHNASCKCESHLSYVSWRHSISV